MLDPVMMRRAIELAKNSLYISDPNPRVGCVIVRDNVVLAEGWTQRAGGFHAEIHALEQIGHGAQGADVYVSLEPCSHTGRTGPCAKALVKAGVRRVFAATADPNPLVKGAGFKLLKDAGIKVETGLFGEQARRINAGFMRRMKGGLPWVRVKLGASIDGRTATATGQSKWITGLEARADVHHWRARSSAIVTGVETVISDNPSLNARIESDVKQPLRVIADTHLRTPLDSRLFDLDGDVLLATGKSQVDEGRWPAEILSLPCRNHRVSLGALLEALADRGCNEILVEAGATLSGAFLKTGLVDEVILYMAPKLLGNQGRAMFDLGPDLQLDQAIRLNYQDISRIGEDIRIIATPLV